MPHVRASRPIRFTLLTVCGGSAIGAGLAVGLGGCSSLDAIDRRTERLMELQSAELGGGAIAPPIRDLPPGEIASADQADLSPPTTNPPASELAYDQAAADRDVAAALEAYAEIDDEAMRLDLAGVLRVFQNTGREYINAREDYTLAAIRLLQERHRWGPRFFNDLSLSVDSVAGDPDIDIPLRIINELRVTQRLPYGGDVEARLVFDATEQLRRRVEDDTNSAQLLLDGTIPLLRGAGLVAREDLIQRERDVVYAARSFERRRRELLVDIASDYFNLLNQLDRIRNQLASIDSRRQSVERTRAEVQAGRRRALEIRQQQQALLSAEDTLISLRESYLRSLDRFKIRLGLPVTAPLIIERSDLNLPEPNVSPTEASLAAVRYRLDLQTRRDRIDDSRRAVANARNAILPDLDLTGAVNINTDEMDRQGQLDFVFDRPEYFASVTFGLPLDREIERLSLRSSIIGLQRDLRGYEEFRDNVILTARAARRNIDQLRFSLLLNEQRVENIRLQIEEQRLRDDTDPFDLTRSQDDLLEAENNLAQARQQLRTAVLEYLLETGQLRVTLDGRFQPLPGMSDPLPGDQSINEEPPEGGPGPAVGPDERLGVPEADEPEPEPEPGPDEPAAEPGPG